MKTNQTIKPDMLKMFISFFFLWIGIHTYSQENPAVSKLTSFVKNINTFNYLYPQEKVYLHFDNTGYFSGENIWFKAYVVVSEQNTPTMLSKVLYVELLTPDGYIKETKKLKIENGQCHGDFQLDPTWFGGFYEIRAYTRIMLNFGQENIFSRVFPLFNRSGMEGEYKKIMRERPRSKDVPSQREKAEHFKKVNMLFFPEGGNIITGLDTHVAFKIMDENGESISADGVILNDKKEEIGAFRSFHKGMGSFHYTPNGKKHSVKIKYNGKESVFDLPAEKPSGYVMKVDNMRREQILLQIEKTPDKPSETLGVSLSCQGKVYLFDTLSVADSNIRSMIIPKEGFPTGVSQVTLFTSSGEILCERLIFTGDNINSFQPIEIETETDKKSYQPYEKIALDFQVKDVLGSPVATNFSLAVRDRNTETGVWQDNIQTNLLLSSELKGFIENPEYYFESDDNVHRLSLDLLMMTQGWRKYSWTQMAGVEPFKLLYHMEEGLLIDGEILSAFAKKKKENLEVNMWMYSDDGFSQQGKCMTDEEGAFNFMPQDFYGTSELFLSVKEKGKRKNNRIILNRAFSPSAKGYTFFDTSIINRVAKSPETPSQADITEELVKDTVSLKNMAKGSNLLPEVTVKERKPFKPEDLALEQASIVYDVAQEIDKIEDSKDDYSQPLKQFLLKINPYFSERLTPDNKLILMYKGKPVGFGDAFGCLDREPLASEIESIIIVETTTDKGDLPSVYITYKDKRKKDPKGMRSTKLQGYYNAQEFLYPDYRNGPLPNQSDYRRTLYWNPNVKTNQNGEATVNFYNNSTCKTINISAEGLTAKGVPFVAK